MTEWVCRSRSCLCKHKPKCHAMSAHSELPSHYRMRRSSDSTPDSNSSSPRLGSAAHSKVGRLLRNASHAMPSLSCASPSGRFWRVKQGHGLRYRCQHLFRMSYTQSVEDAEVPDPHPHRHAVPGEDNVKHDQYTDCLLWEDRRGGAALCDMTSS